MRRGRINMDQEREWIRRIMLAVNNIDAAYEEVSKISKLKDNEIWILYALDDEKKHSQKQLAEEWLFPKTTLNTIIKELERKGYVSLAPIPGKKREKNISLTPLGDRYLRNALDGLYRAEGEAFAAVKDPRVFTETLERFSEALKERFKTLSEE